MSAIRIVPVIVIADLAIDGKVLGNPASNRPPSDSPRYAGSQQTSFSLNVGWVTECDAEFNAPAKVAAVTECMRAELDSGDWHLVGADQAQGVLNFERRSRPSASGQVQLLGQGDHALAEVQVVNV